MMKWVNYLQMKTPAVLIVDKRIKPPEATFATHLSLERIFRIFLAQVNLNNEDAVARTTKRV